MTIIASIISAIIIYALFFGLPKLIKRKPALLLIDSPAQSAIVIDHVKDYDDDFVELAQMATRISSHEECHYVIKRIMQFEDKYKDLYGAYLVQLDVNTLCDQAEKRLHKLGKSLVLQS